MTFPVVYHHNIDVPLTHCYTAVNQVVSLLSCFVFEEKAEDKGKLREELAGPLRQMQVQTSFGGCDVIVMILAGYGASDCQGVH